ncbi:MAG: polysaccharide deacetylase family protein [bacterium]
MIIIIFLVLIAFSARWNWWRPYSKGISILMYHKIGVPPENSKLKKLWVTSENFRKQMSYLKKHKYEVVAFKTLQSKIENSEKINPKTVIITFDDGYKNNMELGLPILKEFNFPSVIFLVVNAIGNDNFWHDPETESRISMLNEDDISKISPAEVEFGAHTLNHKNLEKLQLDQVEKEIIESKEVLENKLKIEISAFAYPYGSGAFVKGIQDVVRKAGFKAAVSIKQGKADLNDNPFCLKRILIRGDDTMFDFHLNLTRGKSRF